MPFNNWSDCLEGEAGAETIMMNQENYTLTRTAWVYISLSFCLNWNLLSRA